MVQKQLPAFDVERAAERHSDRSHAEHGNEGLRTWSQIGNLGMGQKQLPEMDVKRTAERHSGRTHAERGNEDVWAWRQIGKLILACSLIRACS